MKILAMIWRKRISLKRKKVPIILNMILFMILTFFTIESEIMFSRVGLAKREQIFKNERNFWGKKLYLIGEIRSHKAPITLLATVTNKFWRWTIKTESAKYLWQLNTIQQKWWVFDIQLKEWNQFRWNYFQQ